MGTLGPDFPYTCIPEELSGAKIGIKSEQTITCDQKSSQTCLYLEFNGQFHRAVV